MSVQQPDGSAVTPLSTRNNRGIIRYGGTRAGDDLFGEQPLGNNIKKVDAALIEGYTEKSIDAGDFPVDQYENYIVQQGNPTLAGLPSTVLNNGSAEFLPQESHHRIGGANLTKAATAIREGNYNHSTGQFDPGFPIASPSRLWTIPNNTIAMKTDDCPESITYQKGQSTFSRKYRDELCNISLLTIDEDLQSSLVAGWNMDADGSDSWGSNHLVKVNSPTSPFAEILHEPGKLNNAARFAGDAAYYIDDNADMSFNTDQNFTFTLWAQRTYSVAATGKWLLSKSDSFSPPREYELVLNSSHIPLLIVYDGATHKTVTWGGALSQNVWYFIAIWRDATANEIYIQVDDGVPVSAPCTGTVDGSSQFKIGGVQSPLDSVRGWVGLIDEVFFWKRVLSAAEITQMYELTRPV